MDYSMICQNMEIPYLIPDPEDTERWGVAKVTDDVAIPVRPLCQYCIESGTD